MCGNLSITFFKSFPGGGEEATSAPPPPPFPGLKSLSLATTS